MKNNEWNVPSDYFEKNKKALLPVRKFPKGKWILALAAACLIGVGFFMWKGDNRTQEIAQGERREEEVRDGKMGEDKRGEEEVREGKIGEGKNGEEKVREGKRKEDIAEELKEIPREELVAYLLEEDSDFIENID
jgi:uncharacterized low-complexity protein